MSKLEIEIYVLFHLGFVICEIVLSFCVCVEMAVLERYKITEQNPLKCLTNFHWDVFVFLLFNFSSHFRLEFFKRNYGNNEKTKNVLTPKKFEIDIQHLEKKKKYNQYWTKEKKSVHLMREFIFPSCIHFWHKNWKSKPMF